MSLAGCTVAVLSFLLLGERCSDALPERTTRGREVFPVATSLRLADEAVDLGHANS